MLPIISRGHDNNFVMNGLSLSMWSPGSNLISLLPDNERTDDALYACLRGSTRSVAKPVSAASPSAVTRYLRPLLINGAGANLLRSRATKAYPWVIGLRRRRPSALACRPTLH